MYAGEMCSSKELLIKFAFEASNGFSIHVLVGRRQTRLCSSGSWRAIQMERKVQQLEYQYELIGRLLKNSRWRLAPLGRKKTRNTKMYVIRINPIIGTANLKTQ